MSRVGRFWDWLLPGLICLSPMGSIAYYFADTAIETSHRQDASAPVRVVGTQFETAKELLEAQILAET